MVMGALGRCGGGARKLLQDVGVSDVTLWDIQETAQGGPFLNILEHDIFVNCIYLAHKIPPFLTAEDLSGDHAPK
jgi:saccharopine dehydrogenase (NAD+, L-lysine-forming)